MTHWPLALSGMFLLLCAGTLYRIRKSAAINAVDAWRGLPATSRLRRYETHLKGMTIAATLVSAGGVVLIIEFLVSI